MTAATKKKERILPAASPEKYLFYFVPCVAWLSPAKRRKRLNFANRKAPKRVVTPADLAQVGTRTASHRKVKASKNITLHTKHLDICSIAIISLLAELKLTSHLYSWSCLDFDQSLGVAPLSVG